MMPTRVLHVDLDGQSHETEELPVEVVKTYIGGIGINNYLWSKLVPAGCEPFSGENRVILGAGLFAGTPAPGAGKVMATTRLPVNGAVGTCFGGGSVAAKLRWAGYGHVVIGGKCDSPKYLYVHDGDVELRPADELWGVDLLETTHRMWDRHGGDAAVVAIGSAGEAKVKFAFTMVDNMATLGRGGLGAVLGDKRLKAIVVKGTKGVQIDNGREFLKAALGPKQALEQLPWREDWLKQGIYIGWPVWKKVAFVKKNFTELASEEVAERLGPEEYAEFFSHPLACTGCPMADKGAIRLDEGGQETIYPVSYGLHAALSGGRYDVGEEEALRLMIRANKAGIDDLMLTSVVDFAVDLYKNGVITKANTDGRSLENDVSTLEWLTDKIIRREGIGDILANGYLEALDDFGPEAAKYAHHIKGLDCMVDPRPAFSGFAYAQLTNPRGSYAIAGNSPAFLPGKKASTFARFLEAIGASTDAIERVTGDPDGVNLGRMLRYTEDWYALCSSLGICARQPIFQVYDIGILVNLVNIFTGWGKTKEELIQDGERIWNLTRHLNAREGFTRNEDKMPEVFFRPLRSEKADVAMKDYTQQHVLSPGDIENALTEYYEERGWDTTTGNPTKEKLQELKVV